MDTTAVQQEPAPLLMVVPILLMEQAVVLPMCA